MNYVIEDKLTAFKVTIHRFYHMNNPNPEEPYGEMIQFAIQGAADMAQVTVAVAIGIFGILGIFVAIKAIGGHMMKDPYWWTFEE